MMTPEKYTNKDLSIEVVENQTSIDREPSKFISPILVMVLQMAATMNKRITMDFQHLSYMNSSTITPIIKILDRAKKGMTKITILYRKSLKWQELNFSALEVFRTDDNRLEIKGL